MIRLFPVQVPIDYGNIMYIILSFAVTGNTLETILCMRSFSRHLEARTLYRKLSLEGLVETRWLQCRGWAGTHHQGLLNRSQPKHLTIAKIVFTISYTLLFLGTHWKQYSVCSLVPYCLEPDSLARCSTWWTKRMLYRKLSLEGLVEIRWSQWWW